MVATVCPTSFRGPPIVRALLLAAGRGERMRPLTDDCPKPLLTVGKETLIERHLRKLNEAGVRDVVINVHYRADLIQEVLGNGERYGLNISYSLEQVLLETGGGARQALTFLGDAPFIIVSSDILVDYDYRRLMEPGILKNHVVLVRNPAHHSRGDFRLTADGLARLGNEATFAGIGVISPSLVRRCSKASYPLREVLFPAANEGALTGEMHLGYWSDIGTPQRLSDARADYESGLCR